jgi:uncharacterized protein
VITTEFTPLASLIGGGLIGLAAVLMMALNGRIAGISGIAVRLFPPFIDNESAGRLAFVLGLVAAPLALAFVTGAWAPLDIVDNPVQLFVGAVLVGFGAVWGNGCTSGHGVCGLARLSKRSFIAVAVFMATAIITVFITRHGS